MKTPLQFISTNKGKLKEIKKILPYVKALSLHLHEIQELDPIKVAQEKLKEARRLVDGPILVEDTAVFIEGMNGFPGPMIKWMYQAIGAQGIADLCSRLGTQKAEAKSIFGLDIPGRGELFFEGSLKGEFVSPKGNKGFGWDTIFLPEGRNKTFAELTLEEKNSCSMRYKALIKLKEYLDREGLD